MKLDERDRRQADGSRAVKYYRKLDTTLADLVRGRPGICAGWARR